MIFDVTDINESRITRPKKVRSEPGSDRFGHILNITNTVSEYIKGSRGRIFGEKYPEMRPQGPILLSG
jgi:hypothetical protein